jgi:hypothetical protein
MSRARPWPHPETGEIIWFDQKASRASVEQLELLADYEQIEIDDLLDEGLSARQTLVRIRTAATPGIIPEFVLEARRERLKHHGMQPACRICALNGWECEGKITRHHFIPRWMMLTLENYNSYAARSICTIPICIARHRDLHFRSADPSEDGLKTIVPYLRDHERKFAQKLLNELKTERPHVWELIVSGDEHSYEGQLARDYQRGLFASAENAYKLEEYALNASSVAL